VDFVQCANNKRTAVVRAEWADDIAAALLEGKGCFPVDFGGRGRLERFNYQMGSGLIRKYWRGGLMQYIMRDRYLLENRALGELQLHAKLHELGLPVPPPLGASWERCGPIYRGWFATHEMPAVDLLSYLHSNPDADETILPQCGSVIRFMHDRGVYHADLQVKNILIGDSAIYLIDFDKARIYEKLSPLKRAQNLSRLRRSMRKNGMDDKLFKYLCDGYGAKNLPEWMARILNLHQ
jgi:3-deoxy-D-manno-octulosonic acid kinase